MTKKGLHEHKVGVTFCIEFIGNDDGFADLYFRGVINGAGWYFIIDPLFPPIGPFDSSEDAYDEAVNKLNEWNDIK